MSSYSEGSIGYHSVLSISQSTLNQPLSSTSKGKIEQNFLHLINRLPNSADKMEYIPVYNAAGIENIDQILHELNEEDVNYEIVQGFRNAKPLTILDHFRAVADRDTVAYSRVLFVVDREDVEKYGLLLVKTSYHGFPDAVRCSLNEDNPGGLGASLDIGHQNWAYVREMTYPSDPLKPYRRYGVYNSVLGLEHSSDCSIQITTYDSPREHNPRFYDLLRTLSHGLGDLNEYNENFPEDGRRSEFRDIYVGISTPGKSVEEIKAMHAGVAAENNLDQEYFIFIDQDWEKEGLLFAKFHPKSEEDGLQGGNDEFRHPATSVKAGELLNWIFMGLMTWEDAKASAPADLVEQRKLNEERAQRELEEHRKKMEEYNQRLREAEAQGEEGKTDTAD